MKYEMEDPDSVFGNMTDEELAQLAQDREDAEKAGVFDDIRTYDCPEDPANQLHLTMEQEMTLYSASRDLFELAQETNSTISILLRESGYSG